MFRVFPAGAVLDEQLLAAFDASTSTEVIGYCNPEERCPLLFVDLSRDGSPEAILFYGHAVTGAMRTQEGWQALDHMQRRRMPGAFKDHQAVAQALEQGDYRIGDLPWQVIEIEGQYYVLTEPRGGKKGRKPATAPAAP
jgi:hypothetical protein